MLEKSKCIILSTHEFMESSLICSVLSEKRGLIKFIAKGVRRPKSSLRNVCNLFNSIVAVYYFKRDRELQILKEGQVIKSREKLASSYDRYYLVSKIARFLLAFLPYEGGRELFALVNSLFDYLESCEKVTENIYYAFVLKISYLEGLLPALDRCTLCGKRDVKYFSWEEKGVFCENCIENRENAFKIDTGIIKELELIKKGNWEEISKLRIRNTTLEILKNMPSLKENEREDF